MANNNNAEELATEEETDIFYMQRQLTETLTDLLAKQLPTQQEAIYVQPAAPVYKPPNYLLYIGIGVGLLIYFRKIRL